jgi:hypothetical protein
MTGNPVPIRLGEELLARLDRVTAEMSKRAAGADVPRSSAIRLALERGLDALEAELGLADRRRKPKR